jgi:hypothetical protein
MYGCADPCLVYGFNLNHYNIKINKNWLYDNYPFIQCYGMSIVRNYLSEPIYGFQCHLEVLTGKVRYDEEDTSFEEKEKVIRELYNKYVEYYKKCFNAKDVKNIQLGYHLAVTGWDSEEHVSIDLE